MNTLRAVLFLGVLAALAAGCSSSATTGTTGSTGGTTGSGPAAPATLTITSADKGQISLSWTASATSGVTYTLQRKTTASSDAFVNLAQDLSVTTYQDTTIDRYTDYQYQVQAVAADGSSPFTAASHPAGPPPSGFQTIAPLPSGAQGDHFGSDLCWASDSNGDPVIAFSFRDPNGDGNDDDDEVLSVSWDRATFAWRAPVTVAANLGAMSVASHEVALARDDVSGTLVIAYNKRADPQGSTSLALSKSTDDGAHWSTVGSLAMSAVDVEEPGIGAHGGTVHLAYYTDDGNGSGIHYRTGALSADIGTWTDTTLPLQGPNAGEGSETPLALAMDSSGAPGIAYDVDADGNSDNIVEYWSPTAQGVIQKLDTNSSQDLALAFDGTAPRVAFEGNINGASQDGTLTNVWVSSSTDGHTWSTPVGMPDDQHNSLDEQISIAIGPNHQAAVASESNAGSGDNLCGEPKLSTSADLATWQTCSPDATNTEGLNGGLSNFEIVRFEGNGKMSIAVKNNADPASVQVPDGVVYWRQP